MSVKVVEMYHGRWYVRVVNRHFRKTKHIGFRERAMEVSRKLPPALELYGFNALKMFETKQEQPAVQTAGQESRPKTSSRRFSRY